MKQLLYYQRAGCQNKVSNRQVKQSWFKLDAMLTPVLQAHLHAVSIYFSAFFFETSFYFSFFRTRESRIFQYAFGSILFHLFSVLACVFNVSESLQVFPHCTAITIFSISQSFKTLLIWKKGYINFYKSVYASPYPLAPEARVVSFTDRQIQVLKALIQALLSTS